MQLNDVSANECPRSILRGEVFELLSMWVSSRRFEGAHLFGPDLSRWPARVYDAFELFHGQYARVESEMLAAEKQEAAQER